MTFRKTKKISTSSSFSFKKYILFINYEVIRKRKKESFDNIDVYNTKIKKGKKRSKKYK